VYLNGKKGKAKTHTKNGSGPRIGQKLAIGGRANNDSSHNTASSVSDVRVYDRMLNYQEVAQLYAFGRRSVAPILRNSSVLPDDAYVRLTGKHIEPDCSSVEYKGVLGVFDSSADCLAALKTNKDFNYAVYEANHKCHACLLKENRAVYREASGVVSFHKKQQGAAPKAAALEPALPVMDGLLLDLIGNDFTGGSTWKSRAGTINATVPPTVQFNKAEKAFQFTKGGDVVSVNLPTNPNVMQKCTYELWVKLTSAPGGNMGWVMAQTPDYSWSRAITLNDARLGKVSMTVGGGWDSGVGAAPVGEWLHVVAVWDQGGTSTVYMNGKKGKKQKTSTKNGAGSSKSESLSIGGRANKDASHNTPTLISDVRVYNRMLTDAEVTKLFQYGRRTEKLALAMIPPEAEAGIPKKPSTSFPRTVGWQNIQRTTTYAEAAEQCKASGKTLCTRAEVCPDGHKGGEAPSGGKKSGDVWVPVAGDNDWLQVGNGHWPSCQLHSEINGGKGGKASWGTTSGSHKFRQEAPCCSDSQGTLLEIAQDVLAGKQNTTAFQNAVAASCASFNGVL